MGVGNTGLLWPWFYMQPGLGKNRVSARPNRVILYADMMRISDPVSVARSGKIMMDER
jgi:hypothetical protein